MQETMKKKAVGMLESGAVQKLIGWTAGELPYERIPAVFTSAEEAEKNFIYDDFCVANVSKYVMREQKKDADAKILVFLRSCDTYSFNQLTAENKVCRENVYVIGIGCSGMADTGKIRAAGTEGILRISADGDVYKAETVYGTETVRREDALAERCLVCKSKKLTVYDEIIGEDGDVIADSGRFDMVEKLENMTAEERYDFWRGELSRCIRCNACRNVWPACTCEQCVFDNANSGIAQKAAADSFEENMLHTIRAFHVAGRCTDCGECSRVCPQNIPLHLLNRKFIRDINELYGAYQAGADPESRHPLISFTADDAEPSVVHERGKC